MATEWGAYEVPEHEGFNLAWWVDAPWAHPLWGSYMIMLFDLTEPRTGLGEPVLFMEGATHEVHVIALDPNQSNYRQFPPSYLTPINYAYQFKAKSHEDAQGRILGLIVEISEGRLSPDTDFRSHWDRLFADGAPCRKGRAITFNPH